MTESAESTHKACCVRQIASIVAVSEILHFQELQGRPCQKSGPGSNCKGSKIEKETTCTHSRCHVLESGPLYKKSESVRHRMRTFVCMTLIILNPQFPLNCLHQEKGCLPLSRESGLLLPEDPARTSPEAGTLQYQPSSLSQILALGMQNILEDIRTGDANYKDGRENTLVRDIHSDLDVTF